MGRGGEVEGYALGHEATFKGVDSPLEVNPNESHCHPRSRGFLSPRGHTLRRRVTSLI